MCSVPERHSFQTYRVTILTEVLFKPLTRKEGCYEFNVCICVSVGGIVATERLNRFYFVFFCFLSMIQENSFNRLKIIIINFIVGFILILFQLLLHLLIFLLRYYYFDQY